MLLKEKKILIGVTGSIAAYKIPVLVRLFIKEGAEVKLVLTSAAKDFVTPLTLATLSKNPALTDSFNTADGSWNSHIELGNWADVYIIAPASANTLAKMACGLADNLLTTTYLAAKCPVFIAPAMDLDMYKHSSTQSNIKTLVKQGIHLIQPKEGELASGLCGAGRMEEPEEIVKIIAGFLNKKKDFQKKKILITAGPTFEKIDPVRFIGNRSSGLMGYCLADEFAARGADVTLISGPVAINTENEQIHRVDVETADEMFVQCRKYYSKADVIIMAAAVADYKPVSVSEKKIKKTKTKFNLELTKTIDILMELGKLKNKNQILVGFALETDSEVKNAEEKLIKKNLDLIVLNSLNDKGAGFSSQNNKVTIIRNNKSHLNYKLKSKREVARDIADVITNYF